MELTASEKKVLKVCSEEPGFVECIAAKAGLDIETVQAALLILQEKGLVFCNRAVYSDGTRFWASTLKGDEQMLLC